MRSVEVDGSPSYFVLAGIHYLSGLVPIVATHFLLVLAISKGLTLFLAGTIVSILYNLFAALEKVISELIWSADQQYLPRMRRR